MAWLSNFILVLLVARRGADLCKRSQCHLDEADEESFMQRNVHDIKNKSKGVLHHVKSIKFHQNFTISSGLGADIQKNFSALAASTQHEPVDNVTASPSPSLPWKNESPDSSLSHRLKFGTHAMLKISMLPCALLLIGACLLRVLLRPLQESNDRAELPLAIGFYANFQDNVIFTTALTKSLQYVGSSGSSAVSSGILIGMHKCGTSLGMIAIALGLRLCLKLCENSKAILLLGATLQIVGGFAFFGLGIASANFTELDSVVLLKLLFATRFMQGLGGGLQLGWAWNQSAQALTGLSRSVQNMRNFLAGCLGLGMGPLLISILDLAAGFMFSDVDIGAANMFVLAAFVPLMQLAVLLRVELPILPSANEGASLHEKVMSKTWLPRIIHTLMCIGMQVLRNVTLASLEAGLPQVLQTDYDWTDTRVAMGVCLTIFAVLPVQVLVEKHKSKLSQHAWTVIMLWMSVAASCIMLVPKAVPLVACSIVLHPLMALSSGLIIGRMQEYVLPGGSFLNLSTATLLAVVIGRGQGPPLARWRVSVEGQAGLAHLQIVICAAAALMYHVTVATVSGIGTVDNLGSSDENK